MGYALRDYHESTKHSPASLAQSAHRLDWSNKPLPFKIYNSPEGISFPDDLARLCRYSNGALRWRRGPSGERYGFRAAPVHNGQWALPVSSTLAAEGDIFVRATGFFPPRVWCASKGPDVRPSPGDLRHEYDCIRL